MTQKIIGLKRVELPEQGSQLLLTELTADEQEVLQMLNNQFDNNPGQVKKWQTHDLLSFLLHSKYSGSCITSKSQGYFQQIVEAFIINRVNGANFFNFESESQMLKVLGDKVKALGVRKNLMRVVRKLKQLEERIQQDKDREKEARNLRNSDPQAKVTVTSFSDQLEPP